MDQTKKYKTPVGAKVDPPVKAALERVCDRKRQTVSRFIEHLILTAPSVKAELAKSDQAIAAATS